MFFWCNYLVTSCEWGLLLLKSVVHHLECKSLQLFFTEWRNRFNMDVALLELSPFCGEVCVPECDQEILRPWSSKANTSEVMARIRVAH